MATFIFCSNAFEKDSTFLTSTGLGNTNPIHFKIYSVENLKVGNPVSELIPDRTYAIRLSCSPNFLSFNRDFYWATSGDDQDVTRREIFTRDGTGFRTCDGSIICLNDGENNEHRPPLFPLEACEKITRGPYNENLGIFVTSKRIIPEFGYFPGASVTSFRGKSPIFRKMLDENFSKTGAIVFRQNVPSEIFSRLRAIVLDQDHTRISELLTLDTEFSEILQHDILKVLLDILFPEGHHLTTYSSNTLRKRDKDQRAWHVDYPYHTIAGPYPKEILGVQVIIALNDFTIENGATMYLPQSFESGRFPDSNTLSRARNVDAVEYMTIPKGAMVVYRGDLWHSQGINTTDDPRVALLANFSPLSVKAKDNIVGQLYGADTPPGVKIVEGKVRLWNAD